MRPYPPAFLLPAVLGLAACGGSGTSTIHGTVTPSGPGIADLYGFCSEDSPSGSAICQLVSWYHP